MSASEYGELYFLLDRAGAIIAYQEKDQSWAGALAFSSEGQARAFVASSGVDAGEIAAVDTADREGLAGLIGALKRQPIRYLLLDLDYRSGVAQQIAFDGERLGGAVARVFAPAAASRGTRAPAR